MLRSFCLASLTLLTFSAMTAVPTLAEAGPDGVRSQPILLTAMAGARVEVAAAQLVVFQNDADTLARVIFRAADADAVDCQESPGVSRSRKGQYTVRGGSELVCQLEPGSYRYETLTNRNGAVTRTRSRISAR